MKEAELRKHANCSRCKKKLGESSLPIFSVVRVQHWIIDLFAVQRQTGLGQMLGDGLAMHMGPDDDLAIQDGESADITLCASCRAGFLEWLEDA